VLETVYWDAGTARLLPSAEGPRPRAGVHHPQSRQGSQPTRRLPGHGFARFWYGQARALLDEHTAMRRTWDGLGSA
jgi:hypothetical protein